MLLQIWWLQEAAAAAGKMKTLAAEWNLQNFVAKTEATLCFVCVSVNAAVRVYIFGKCCCNVFVSALWIMKVFLSLKKKAILEKWESADYPTWQR